MREKKTMKNKKKLLSCISLLAFAALAAGFAGAGVRANAAETAGETQKTNGFYMEAGASVRIDGKAGVRFQAYLSADKYAELIETPQQAGKDVKIYAVANRSDTGATLGATNAVRQEVSLPLPDENGGYTLQARVTYDELAAGTIKKAAAVEISARYYIVTDGEEQSAVAAEEDDNSRSMRAVANAALTKGDVEKSAVENYLGNVTNVYVAGKMYVSDMQTIDLSGVIGNDVSAAYDTAYFGAKKVGTVAKNKVSLNTPVKAEIGEEFPLTLMDSENNVLNTSFVYGYTTISGSVQGASGTVTATTAGGKTFAGEITDENAYTVDVLANETYNLYFDCGSDATATDGILNGVAVQTEAVTANLDKTYAKVKGVKHGGGSGDTYGDWTRTANGEYTAKRLADENSYTLGAFAEAEDFYVSARIQGGKGNYVGAGVNIVGDDFGDDTANKNLQFFKINSDSFVQLYSWGPGEWQNGIECGAMIEKDGNSADNFVFTLIRYEKAFHVFINGHFVKTWENTVEDSGRTIDLTKIGTVVPGMLLRGNYGSTDVRFSEWEYTSDKTAVAEKLALGRIGGTVEGGNGTVTATLVENGVETNVKYAAKITNKAYSLSLTAGKTYNLYFDCGTTDGIIQGVTATKEGVTKNLDKTYAKITVATPGGKGTEAGTRGTWTRSANNEYTVEGLHHDDAFTIAQFGKSENFIVSARIQGGSGMQAGFTMLTGGTVQNLQIFRNGNDSATGARKFTMYSWGVQWIKSGLLDKSAPFDDDNYTLTLIKYENKLHLYVDNTFLVTFEGTIKATNGTLDFSTLGSVTVGMSLRGKSSKTAKFSDWSYSAADSDITAYISAHNS